MIILANVCEWWMFFFLMKKAVWHVCLYRMLNRTRISYLRWIDYNYIQPDELRFVWRNNTATLDQTKRYITGITNKVSGTKIAVKIVHGKMCMRMQSAIWWMAWCENIRYYKCFKYMVVNCRYFFHKYYKSSCTYLRDCVVQNGF